jgi:tripartite ATP-independent transporter DctM subunit
MSLLTLAIAVILFFILLEAPLFLCIAGLAIVLLLNADADPTSLQMILIEMNRLATMPVLVALPLFTMVGCVLTASGAPKRILAFLEAAVGWLPGGSAVAALMGCAFFTALTGASGVTIMALGAVMLPILKQQRYGENFSLGLLTTGGSLGLLFAPSLPVILYGVVAQIDITTIFKATLIPGMMLLIVLSAYAIVRPGNIARRSRISGRQVAVAFRQGFWEWLLIALILFGIYGGFVTIGEVSAIALIYVIAVACFIHKEIHWARQLPGIMIDSAMLCGAIVVILGMALGLTGFLVDAQVPNRILNWFSGLTDNKWVFLAGLNIFLIVVGCIMDIFSAIVVIVPIIAPLAQSYGIDPYHLCAIFLVNLEIGYSTPPVGMNLFIASLKFERPITVLYRASVPYLVLLIVCLLLVTYVPAFSLWLVSL